MRSFTPAGFFALRTPLLPFDEFQSWSSGLEAPAARGNPDHLAGALQRDRVRLRAGLLERMSRPEMREALFLASPRLDEDFDVWVREPEGERGQKMELALLRYFARSAGRATPYGLCAGGSVGTVGEATRLELRGRRDYMRHTRLGMDYLFSLTESLRKDPELRKAFTYRPNSSLYRAGGKLRFVASRMEGKVRSYHLVMVEETDYLSATLARSESGAELGALAKALVDADVTLEEAQAYLGELLESQILVADIALPLTGREAVAPLAEQLQRYAGTRPTAERLAAVGSSLAAMDAQGLGIAPERYRSIALGVADMPGAVDLGRLFQVDLVKPVREATLGKAVLEEVMRGVELLHAIEPAVRHDSLGKFRTDFTNRYGTREVSLLEVLDDEFGIGLGTGRESTPLLQGLEFHQKSEGTSDWGPRETLLLWKLSEALRDGSQAIELTPDDVRVLSAKEPLPLPPTFAAMFSVAAASDEDVAVGKFRVGLKFVDGPSSARLLARFCFADEGLRKLVEQHVHASSGAKSGPIEAEVVHLPEGHSGNFLCRPALHGYEVPYLGCSGAPPDRQIPVTDLTVTVIQERVLLRSRRLGREILPRMTNAHNFNLSTLGVYRFLCALEGQGIAQGLFWKWGAMDAAPFLPRVTSGRLVLSAARWRLSGDEIRQFRALKGDALFESVQAWRTRLRMPRWLSVAERDQTLPVDLDNVASVEMMIQIVGNNADATLVELLSAPDELLARGPEGRFFHEIVMPFARTPFAATPGVTAVDGGNASGAAHPEVDVARTFPPGSEWLFAKVYTGSTAADTVLREVIGPLVRRSMESGVLDQWFYIRYSDPDWHLRLRFHGAPGRLHAELLPELEAALSPMLADGRVWRLEVGTYEREVERYGGAEGILLAERIFHADSEATLQMLELLEPGDEGLSERWRLALCGIDVLLSDFGLDIEAKYALFKMLSVSIADRVGGRGAIESQLSEKFRGERRELDELLDTCARGEGPWAPAFRLLAERSLLLVPIVSALRACESGGTLSVTLREMLVALVHMHVNRALRAPDYEQETVLYDFLHRLYKSKAARARKL